MVNKIKDEVSDLYIFVNDINYEIKINNKCIEREERVIYFALKKYFDNLKEENAIEFFVGVTFKIILKKFHPYNYLFYLEYPKKKYPSNNFIYIIKIFRSYYLQRIFEYT